MRDYKEETEKRVNFIKNILIESGAKGLIYGNSGGKDSALVGILCKMACDNTLGIIMPCESKRNYTIDCQDGIEVAKKFNIETKFVDITPIKQSVVEQVKCVCELNGLAKANVNPRLRMLTLYAIASEQNRLVVGTGNRSENYVGYFTKWGDGAFDLNPIAELTVKEIYEFLRYLNCPKCIIEKAPSAALFEGQTDENEMGFSYNELDSYLLKTDEKISDATIKKIEEMHKKSEHKRIGGKIYREFALDKVK